MRFRVLRAAAVLASLTFSVAPSAAGAAPDDARALLARYTAFVGRPAGLVVTYSEGRATEQTESSRAAPPAGVPDADEDWVLTQYRRGTAYHRIDTAGKRHLESGFDGHAFWHANDNRYTVVELEDAAKADITDNAIATATFDGVTSAADRGLSTVDGRRVRTVRIAVRGGADADLDMDPDTGELVRQTLAPDDPSMRDVTHVDGFKELSPGVRVPSSLRFGDGTRAYRLIAAHVRDVTDAELAPPLPAPQWSFGDPAPITIAHGTYGGGREVIVQAAINGHVGRFLLDSGAADIILSRPFADKLGVTWLGRSSFSGVNGGVRHSRVARVDSIAIGNNVLSNVVVTVAESGGRSSVDGILGFDVFAGALVNVDLVAERIAFGDPRTLEPAVPKGAVAFPVNLAAQSPEARIRVAGIDTLATFDSGDDFFLTLSDGFRTRNNIVAIPQDRIYVLGVDGVSNEPLTCYDISTVSVGPYRYEHPVTCFGQERVFGRNGGLIGFDFLRHFNWTFDYGRSRIVLVPNGR